MGYDLSLIFALWVEHNSSDDVECEEVDGNADPEIVVWEIVQLLDAADEDGIVGAVAEEEVASVRGRGQQG